jgi:PEP-CTERM motif-containing protein
MNRFALVLSGAVMAVAFSTPAQAGPHNVALGGAVTTSGVVGVMAGCCWSPGPLAPLSSVTDGVFLPEGNVWQTNTVWWDERHAPSLNNFLEIDLGGNALVSELWLQADNNDAYYISMRNWTGTWIGLGWFNPFGGAGMRTRMAALAPLQASAFRIDPFNGDGLYSVSEFQAIGVPEPGVLALLGLGVAGVIRRRIRG